MTATKDNGVVNAGKNVDGKDALIALLTTELQWCSGSEDFGPGGKAHLGWVRGPGAVLEMSVDDALKEYERRQAGGDPVPSPELIDGHMHCDDVVEDYEAADCLRFWLLINRLPAILKFLCDEVGVKPELYAKLGKVQVRVVMASRMGDVGITPNLGTDRGYDRRVFVDQLTDFSPHQIGKPPAANSDEEFAKTLAILKVLNVDDEALLRMKARKLKEGDAESWQIGEMVLRALEHVTRKKPKSGA